MHHLLIALATAPAPSPTPSLRPGLSEDQVTPGTWGFIMTAFFVLATTLLIVDMVRRIRRVRYRAQVEEERMAAAMAAAEQDMLEVPGTGDAATHPAGTQASDTQPAGTQASGTQGGAESRTEPDGDEGRGRS
ncbi:hypothetical protein [Arthrobacter oryzae]|uniref:hypothetical protein n=1 Tax=Arthrobacter oryzae TaxID=409290 RepID=UPI00278B1547|nr:hypothetical protein [Arthrobacter oryzae]MDQ0078828.1 hypothetical protein [Arthrobacter oryzae]